MVVAPQTLLEDAPVTNDVALLDGAASAWAVIAFAAELPATPEQKEALDKARTRIVHHAEAFGFDEGVIRQHLARLADARLTRSYAPPRLVE
jgi:hypothetical protein